MRQRRKSLEVSTFPFLAVLLCTMGSLILLLLVIDRRARVVAAAKARAALQQSAQEDVKQTEARRAEWERRRRLLHEQLAGENAELLQQLSAARAKEDRLAGAVHAKQTELERLRSQLDSQQLQLARWEGDLSARRHEIAQASKETGASQRELALLSSELRRMERTLDDLKRLRQRQQQTYSLVPYRGKRGDNRKPLYLECTAFSLVFHPDHQTITTGPAFTAAGLKDEIERRFAARRASTTAVNDKLDDKGYILLLVRPDGITTYYRITNILQALKIDFGYEFIDADWMLDFPEDDTQPLNQPWMTAQSNGVPPSGTGPVRKVTGVQPDRAGAFPQDQELAGTNASSALQTRGKAPMLGAPRSTRGAGVGPFAEPPSGGSNFEKQNASPFGNAGSVSDGANAASGMPSVGLGQPRGLTSSGGPAILPNGDQSGGQVVSGGQGNSMSDYPGGAPGRSGEPRTASRVASNSAQDAGTAGPPIVGKQSAKLGGGAQGMPASPGATSGNGSERNGLPREIDQSAGASGAATGPAQPGNESEGNGLPREIDQSAGAGGQATGPAQQGEASMLRSPIRGQAAPAAGSAPGGAPGAEGSENQPGNGHDDSGASAGNGGRELSRDPLTGLASKESQKKPVRSAGLRPTSLNGNRDWIIPLECVGDAVLIVNTAQRVALADLAANSGAGNPLTTAVQRMIARRQASVRPGETPYRPIIRFRVHTSGLRTYYYAYPALEALGVQMSREDLQIDEEPKQTLSR